MNKPKLKKKTATPESIEQARSTGQSIVDSAQHIWLAGLGAFAKAQAEGTKLFDRLVREGMAVDARTRKFTEGKVGDMRGTVESTVGQARQRTQETWDNLEKIFESRVSRSLNRLGIPSRDEIKTLSGRVENLSQQVGGLNSKGGARVAKKSSAAVKAAAVKVAEAKRKASRSVARVRDELADVAKELEAAQLASSKPRAATRPAKAASAKKPAKSAAAKKPAKAPKAAKPAAKPKKASKARARSK